MPLLFILLWLVLPLRAQDPCAPSSCPAVHDLSLAVDAFEQAEKGPAQPYFAPYDDVEGAVLRVLDSAQSEVLVAHYNIRRQSVLDKLVELAQRGVKVRVVVDQTNAGREWNLGDDFLEQNGIELLRSKPSGRRALMHLKVAVVDGQRVMTGSFNWNATAALANDENMLLVADAELAQAYRDQVLELLEGKRSKGGGGKVNDAFSLYFSPEVRLDTVIASQIKKAEESIELAMFTLTDRKVQDALIKAVQRGVEVTVVTEQKQAAKTALDEKIEQAGATVVRGANRVGAYSAMHHKYAIIDGERVLTGATNWTKNGTRYSDEDLLIVESEVLAAQYQANFADLLHVYGGIDSPSQREAAPVMFHAEHDGTAYGDRVVLVGNDPALGNWDPHRGLDLQTSDDLFPSWAAHVNLPAGSQLEYKFVTIRPDGSVEWEPGANRVLQVPESGRATVISGDFGDTSSNWTPAGHVDAAVRIPDYLDLGADGSYSSPGGLVYAADLSYGNRAAHVLAHTEDSGEKASQGVFTVLKEEIFPLIDQAWAQASQDLDAYLAEDQGKRMAYEIPMGRVIGYVGGQEEQGQPASTLRLVIQEGNQVVTAFPVEP